MKKNKVTDCDGIPADVWKMVCTMKDGAGILTNVFKKLKTGVSTGLETCNYISNFNGFRSHRNMVKYFL
jgi:hypothetical protein